VAIMALLLDVTASARAQSFTRWQNIPTWSDQDFRVDWSDSDPFEVHDWNGHFYVKNVHIAYMTQIRGKGVLTGLEIYPNAETSLLNRLLRTKHGADQRASSSTRDGDSSFAVLTVFSTVGQF